MELLTVGHGTLDQQDLAQLLLGAGAEQLVDVRTAPGSRRHPHFARSEMQRWLPAAGIAYLWEPRLGGWRKPEPSSPNTALRNDSFRGYADYMRSALFWDALDEVLTGAAARRTVLMCSESLYWRCHRRLIADAAVLARGTPVDHLGHDGHTTAHRLTEGMRLHGDRLVYDVGVTPGLPDMAG
jgi:uncharacterized protein (DUF488 family)